MKPDEVLLSAIRYYVTVQDGQVIFEQADNIYGTWSRFTLEKPTEINDSPGTWKLIEIDGWGDNPMSMTRLMRAFDYVKTRFGGDFEPFIDATKL